MRRIRYMRASSWLVACLLLLAGCSTLSEEQPTLLVDGKDSEVAALESQTLSGTVELSIRDSRIAGAERVEYYLDDLQARGEPWETATEWPFSMELDTTEFENGEHSITALAYVNENVFRYQGFFTFDNSNEGPVDDSGPPSNPGGSNPTPPSNTPEEPQGDMETRMLGLVNEARSTGYDCGIYGYFGPTTPLELDSRLNEAAKVQANHLANRSLFGHVGPGGNSVSDRVSATGYNGFATGENVAAGQDSTKEVVQGWLESDGHCRGIMNPDAGEMGTAVTEGASYGENPDGSITWYEGLQWVQVFAAPR